LGNASIATIRAQVTTITALSDCRDKTNIQGIPVGLDFIKSVRPVKFTWNMRDGAKVGVEEHGFIAQELDDVQKTHDAEWLNLVLKDNPDRLEATPGKLLPVMIKAIQELEEKVAALTSIGADTQQVAEYPSIEDRLDDLYHLGLFSAEMTAAIKAVKSKYSK
jgi:hypothetical protein